MKDSTRIIHSHDKQKPETVRMVNPATNRGSTVLFDTFEEFQLANTGKHSGITYGTDRLPAQRAFEEAICQLEDGSITRAFQSGLSAITTSILAFTNAGDHILVCDNTYGPTTRFCRTILPKYNISTDYLPGNIGADIESYIKPNTKLIFLESPGSNTFEIQDVPAITKIAQARGIVTILDNTWATPLYYKPLQLGVDISIQSVTKYISGHSDLLMGTATVNEKYAKDFVHFYRMFELFTTSEDSYQALRGLKTLPVRLKQHEKSALKIANWLLEQDIVAEVIHPALPNHPEHSIWQRDFTGSSGLFSFVFKEDYSIETIGTFLNSLEFFGIGYSWGGFHSLVTASKYNRETGSIYTDKTVIRLNIGLEDTDDLIDDLAKGFGRL